MIGWIGWVGKSMLHLMLYDESSWEQSERKFHNVAILILTTSAFCLAQFFLIDDEMGARRN